MKNKLKGHWLILILLALAQFMVVLDVSIVNVMLPTVQKVFGMSQANLQWVVTAYTLAFGGFLLLGGRAADLYGRRKVFLSGVFMFSLVSLLDGLSQSGNMLIVLRAFQGLAGAFMSPAALSIILVTYKQGHDRNVALSVWGAVASGGAAVGVLLGGILTQYFGWRWNFLINVPVGLFVFFWARRLLPVHESEETNKSLDLPGAVSITAGLMLLVYALQKAPANGWTSHTTIYTLLASLVLILIFVINEQKAKKPLVPFRIFKYKNLAAANIVQLSIAGALFSVFFFTSLYVQEILHFSPVKTGLCFLIIPAFIGVTASNAPKFIKRFGYKRILTIAPVISASGLLYLSYIPVHGSYLRDVMPGLMLMGSGLGFIFVSLLVAGTSGVEGKLSGLASGLINTSQQLGGSLGLAIISGQVAASTTRYITNSNIHAASTVIAGTVHGYQVAFKFAAAFALLAGLIALVLIRNVKSSENNEDAIKMAAA
jgi:MFS family permease